MKKRDIIPALLRSGVVESDGRSEALIPEAAKKNKSHISPKTKAILKQPHISPKMYMKKGTTLEFVVPKTENGRN
jgi:hypothetical protein